ncbi:GGDEF domain-containing protein [Caminibacter sp.]
MVKKIYFYTLGIFTLFIISVIILNIWTYKIESKTAISITSSYQYNFIINENMDNRLYLIKNVLNKYYKSILTNKIKNQEKLIENDTDKLIILLKTLEKLNFKNYKPFLFKYIYNLYDEDIDIIQNNKILISKNPENIGKRFDYKKICDPFENYGKCAVIKENKFYLIKYSPAYHLIIETEFNIENIDKSDINKNILSMLKSIPGIIIYQNGKKITGEFKKDEFYFFEQFKPLNIFFGFGIKYSKIEKLSNDINKEVIKALKPVILTVIIFYLILIAVFYLMFFTVFRKKINFIEKVLDEYSKKATTDKLTGVYNRRGFEKALEKFPCQHFLIVDLDNFKYINDTFGHEKGDEILKEFAWLLKKYFKDGIIGRWGGDEFLICTNKNKKQIISIINTINKNLRKIQQQFDSKMEKKLSLSAGACSDKEAPFEERFKNADLALYKVKKTKKGNILFFKDIDYIKMEKKDLK